MGYDDGAALDSSTKEKKKKKKEKKEEKKPGRQQTQVASREHQISTRCRPSRAKRRSQGSACSLPGAAQLSSERKTGLQPSSEKKQHRLSLHSRALDRATENREIRWYHSTHSARC